MKIMTKVLIAVALIIICASLFTIYLSLTNNTNNPMYFGIFGLCFLVAIIFMFLRGFRKKGWNKC